MNLASLLEMNQLLKRLTAEAEIVFKVMQDHKPSIESYILILESTQRSLEIQRLMLETFKEVVAAGPTATSPSEKL